jgi:hypothetical protein
MELPEDVIAIIKAYSQPVTRPGWRKLHIMSSYHFHKAIVYKYNHNRRSRWSKVIYEFVCKYVRNPQDKFLYVYNCSMDYNRFVSILELRMNHSYFK